MNIRAIARNKSNALKIEYLDAAFTNNPMAIHSKLICIQLLLKKKG